MVDLIQNVSLILLAFAGYFQNRAINRYRYQVQALRLAVVPSRVRK